MKKVSISGLNRQVILLEGKKISISIAQGAEYLKCLRTYIRKKCGKDIYVVLRGMASNWR